MVQVVHDPNNLLHAYFYDELPEVWRRNVFAPFITDLGKKLIEQFRPNVRMCDARAMPHIRKPGGTSDPVWDITKPAFKFGVTIGRGYEQRPYGIYTTWNVDVLGEHEGVKLYSCMQIPVWMPEDNVRRRGIRWGRLLQGFFGPNADIELPEEYGGGRYRMVEARWAPPGDELASEFQETDDNDMFRQTGQGAIETVVRSGAGYAVRHNGHVACVRHRDYDRWLS